MAHTGTASDYEQAVKCLRTRLTGLTAMRAMITRLESEGRLDMLFLMMNTFLKRGGIQDHELEKVPIIHIAGTKGKGSTSAFTESILRHHGYRTGLFTSPHMYQIRERICINGRPISKQKFCDYFWDVFKKFEDSVFESSIEEGGQMPGFFDLMTVMAMRVFISEGVDVIVLEVGKGGYTDRTNFVRFPVVCGITALALEHTESLGSTIEKIAWHKAGIIKANRPVITLNQDPKALQVILDIATQKQAPVYIAMPLPQSVLNEYCFTLGIKGPVQVQNAGLAVQLFRAWEIWKGVAKPKQVNGITKINSIEDIPRLRCEALELNVIKGLSSCLLHGRTEIIRRDNVSYYLDCAHTQESMQCCVKWFEKAACEEATSLSGKKVARVLQFYCLPVKNPQRLLRILKNMNFDGAAFSWSRASQDEPLGQHSDQLFAKVNADVENALVKSLGSFWRSCDVNKCIEPSLEPEFQHCPSTNGLTMSSLKQENLDIFNSCNKIDGEHILTNGYNFYLNGTKILQNGDEVHLEGIDSGNKPIKEQGASEFATGRLTNQQTLYSGTDVSPSLPNGKNHPTECLDSQTFECALQALVWATQGKDPAVSLSMRAPKESLPGAPQPMKEADHIQVLVTGCIKLVGIVLSVLYPNMND